MKIINQLKKLNLADITSNDKTMNAIQFSLLNLNVYIFKKYSKGKKSNMINVMITDNDNFESLVCFHPRDSLSLNDLYDIISSELIKQWPAVDSVL